MAKAQAVLLAFLLVTTPQLSSAFWRELGGFVAGGALAAGFIPFTPMIAPVAAAYGSAKLAIIVVGAAAGAYRAHESKDGGC